MFYWNLLSRVTKLTVIGSLFDIQFILISPLDCKYMASKANRNAQNLPTDKTVKMSLTTVPLESCPRSQMTHPSPSKGMDHIWMVAIIFMMGTKYACNLSHKWDYNPDKNGDVICFQSEFQKGLNMLAISNVKRTIYACNSFGANFDIASIFGSFWKRLQA